jgi:hypothetical protein
MLQSHKNEGSINPLFSEVLDVASLLHYYGQIVVGSQN